MYSIHETTIIHNVPDPSVDAFIGEEFAIALMSMLLVLIFHLTMNLKLILKVYQVMA